MVPYRIILADHCAPLRQGLRRIIAEQSDLEISGEACEVPDLLKLLDSSAAGPLTVVIGPSLPNLPRTEAIRAVKAAHPGTKVLILSMDEDVEYLTKALSAGVEGYLIIDHIDREFLRAIETIREGKVYVPRSRLPVGPA